MTTLHTRTHPHPESKNLIVISGQPRPESEIINGLKNRLDCLLNQWAISSAAQDAIDNIRMQLEELGLSPKKLVKLEYIKIFT